MIKSAKLTTLLTTSWWMQWCNKRGFCSCRCRRCPEGPPQHAQCCSLRYVCTQKEGNNVRSCWEKLTSAGGPSRSLVGGSTGRRQLAHVLSTDSVAGSTPGQLLSTPSTMASGVLPVESRLRTLVRNYDQDEFALLGNNVSLCLHKTDNWQPIITLVLRLTSLSCSISKKNLIIVAEGDNTER